MGWLGSRVWLYWWLRRVVKLYIQSTESKTMKSWDLSYSHQPLCASSMAGSWWVRDMEYRNMGERKLTVMVILELKHHVPETQQTVICQSCFFIQCTLFSEVICPYHPAPIQGYNLDTYIRKHHVVPFSSFSYLLKRWVSELWVPIWWWWVGYPFPCLFL